MKEPKWLSVLENIVLVFGVVLAPFFIWVSPYSPRSLSSFIGGLSAGLFLTGVALKIYRIDKTTSEMNSQHLREPSIEYIVKEISRHTQDERPLYIQTTSKIFIQYTYNEVRKNGTNIVKHINSANEPIVIDNITPAYRLMRALVRDIGYGYAYLATSKLTSYKFIPNPDFAKFSELLEQRAMQQEAIVSRLYYLDGKPDRGKQSEMEREAKSKIVMKYIVDGEKRFRYHASRDLAILMSPPRDRKFSIPSIEEMQEIIRNSDRPVEELYRLHYKPMCVIHFKLQNTRLNDSFSIQDVEHMKIFSPRNHNAFNGIIEEFELNWSKANPLKNM